MDIMNPELDTVIDTLDVYCAKLLEKEKAKYMTFVQDLFLPVFVNAVKKAEHYQKR